MSDINLLKNKLVRSRKFVAIPDPMPGDIDSMHRTLLAMKQNLEVLTKQRGDTKYGAVTLEDLQALGFTDLI